MVIQNEFPKLDVLFDDGVCIALKAVAKIMQDQLADFLKKEIQLKKTDRLLLAVSGGADSMVMLHMLLRLNDDVVVAHVNFGLRGDESDKDARFVKETCDELGVPCFIKEVDTNQESQLRKKGIQETAREIRYEWFETLRQEQSCTFIATAHNTTDNVETVLINQIRGTGLRGFAGIPVKRNNLIRPLILFTSQQIRQFAKENSISFRNDSSNASDKYLRNKIRHHIIPELQSIDEEVETRFLKNSESVTEWLQLFDFVIDEISNKLVTRQPNGEINIPISSIVSYPQAHLLLYSILNSHGFSIDQCLDMVSNQASGNQYFSTLKQVVVHKDNWIVASLDASRLDQLIIYKEGDYVFGDFEISVMQVPVDTVDFSAGRSLSYFDAFEMPLPLTVRSWQIGDYIHPYGMKGRKLLSDLFSEAQVPVHRRKQIPIFIHGDEIIWVGGIRQANKGKITDKTLMAWRIDVFE